MQRKGARAKSRTHPPTGLRLSPTSLVAIATEQEVGIFRGHVAVRSNPEIVTPVRAPSGLRRGHTVVLLRSRSEVNFKTLLSC